MTTQFSSLSTTPQRSRYIPVGMGMGMPSSSSSGNIPSSSIMATPGVGRGTPGPMVHPIIGGGMGVNIGLGGRTGREVSYMGQPQQVPMLQPGRKGVNRVCEMTSRLSVLQSDLLQSRQRRKQMNAARIAETDEKIDQGIEYSNGVFERFKDNVISLRQEIEDLISARKETSHRLKISIAELSRLCHQQIDICKQEEDIMEKRCQTQIDSTLAALRQELILDEQDEYKRRQNSPSQSLRDKTQQLRDNTAALGLDGAHLLEEEEKLLDDEMGSVKQSLEEMRLQYTHFSDAFLQEFERRVMDLETTIHNLKEDRVASQTTVMAMLEEVTAQYFAATSS